MDDMSSWLLIAVLLLCAAYFAAAETAYASVSRIRIKTRADKGDRRAEKALEILDQFEKAITTILIGNNIVHLATASVATLIATRRWGLSAVAVSTVITTMVVFFAGEMLPKSIGKRYSERIALAVASPLRFLMRVFSPISSLLALIGAGVTRLTGKDTEVTVTEDELYDIIETMKDEGELDAEKGELVHSALVFDDITVESVLTARVDVIAIDVAWEPETVIQLIREQYHSRIPVYRGSIDNIIGVLQIRKYIKAYMKQGTEVDLESLLDAPYFIHQSGKIDDLLREMSLRKLNMAVVTDNYGGTLGIVTVEDILEELVGEIWDEDDEIVELFVQLPDGRFEFDAELEVEEVLERMGYEDPEDTDWEHKLIGEWVYEQFEFIPREGDSFGYHELRFSISQMKQNRIVKLIAELPAAVMEGGEQA